MFLFKGKSVLLELLKGSEGKQDNIERWGGGGRGRGGGGELPKPKAFMPKKKNFIYLKKLKKYST